MQNALVIGASGGIGAAIVNELATRGWHPTALSRSVDGLDVTDEASVEHALASDFTLEYIDDFLLRSLWPTIRLGNEWVRFACFFPPAIGFQPAAAEYKIRVTK